MSVKVGLLGLGTVGSGVIDIVQSKLEEYSSSMGLDIELALLCARSAETRQAFEEQGYTTTADPMDVLTHPDIQIVCELVGGYDLPREWILKAFEEGKHVVTANKALIAKYGAELFPVAAEKNLYFSFEAAVAGGIPIIKTVQDSLVGNTINSLAGIINGTCNYILTEMTEKGGDFGPILKVAQELGYAEADPEFDVEGIDAAHKLAILASLATKKFVDFEKIHISGISKIQSIDIQMAKEMNCSIKLLGYFKQTENGIDARVHPAILPSSHLLSNVNDVLNAVYMETSALGSTLLTGAGAGKLPTASAVVGDLIYIANHLAHGQANPPKMGYYAQDNAAQLMPFEDVKSTYYLRFTTKDEVGVLASITHSLSENGISIKSIIQKDVVDPGQVNIIVLTHTTQEKKVQAAIDKLKGSSCLVSEPQLIRFAE